MALPESPEPSAVQRPAYRLADVLALYPSVRDDHLRTLQRWGLIGAPDDRAGERFIGFADVAVIRHFHAELRRGAAFRLVLRASLAARAGQLAFDFRADARPARVIALKPQPQARAEGRFVRREARRNGPCALADRAVAERYFSLASSLDDGTAEKRERAADAYRHALEADPTLVPALVNLANLHYSSGRLIEAMALYERAVALQPDAFEGCFNLGNVQHELGDYRAAAFSYVQALALDPGHADAHLYLAVVLEKDGRSEEAKPHWRSYCSLAPDGEWASLARELSE
ncbi:MAG TPA: tetratricopeptide repeat protein [Vicinamibacterales bacterium]|nr:tetratricopeptide repeat protein [Vicinamibacterales bacterium]